ncbi:MAG: hypothetical protein FJ303_21595 [Planctomycetes bacterium]|nr:hypothetical protein [Planctomycetota bacterium]
MKRIALLIAFVAALCLILPLTAADAKKDVDKKDAEKKETDKKDPEKKEEKKKEKLVFGAKFVTKIVNIKGETNREYIVETQEIDPAKVQANQTWAVQRQQQLAQQYAQALQQKDFKARAQALANYQRDSQNYQFELAKRATQIYSTKNAEIRAAENARVRSNILPIEFDDTGNQKKFTAKEIEARKDKIGLPGHFPSEFDAIKPGQFVEVYMTKIAPPAKGKKKDDDEPGVRDRSREFVLIVILADPK